MKQRLLFSSAYKPPSAEYEDNNDPLGLVASEFSCTRHLLGVTPNAWVQYRNGTYILQTAKPGIAMFVKSLKSEFAAFTNLEGQTRIDPSIHV